MDLAELQKKAKSDLSVALAKGRIVSVLENSGLDKAGQRDLLRKAVLLGGKLDDEMHRPALRKLIREGNEIAGKLDTWKAAIEKAAKEAPMPPLTSANNVEAAIQGVSHVWAACALFDEWQPDMIDALRDMSPAIEKQRVYGNAAINMVCGGHWGLAEIKEPANASELEMIHDLSFFAMRWRESAYPKLEIGHKLAASLCLTDIPDDLEVKMPWPAWSLIIPDGLLGKLARVWVLDAEEISSCGKPMRMRATILLDRQGKHPGHVDDVTAGMIQSLVCGAALALSNPEEFRKERHHKPSARSAKRRHSGPPDLACSRFLLSAPVTVDLREHVTAAIDEGRGGTRKGSSPKVVYLVRGHWRQQAHGPQHSLRKTLWIKPFWRGPEEARVLLRTYKMEE